MLRSHAHPFTWQRDPRSGNHLLSYCATSEPLQTVHITPSTDVRLDFHFPPTVKLAQRVRVLALGDGSATPSLVGELAQGGRVSTRACMRRLLAKHAEVTCERPRHFGSRRRRR